MNALMNATMNALRNALRNTMIYAFGNAIVNAN